MTAQAEASLQALISEWGIDGLLRRLAIRIEIDADRTENTVLHAVFVREARLLRESSYRLKDVK